MNKNTAAKKIQRASSNYQNAWTNKIEMEKVNKQFYVEWKTGKKVHRYKPSTFFQLLSSDERLNIQKDESFADLVLEMLRNPDMTFRDPFTRINIKLKNVDIVIRGKKAMSDPDVPMFERALIKYRPRNINAFQLDAFIGFMKGYQIQRETRLNNAAILQTYLPDIVGDLIYPAKRVYNNNLNSIVRLGDKMYKKGKKVVKQYAEDRAKFPKDKRDEYDRKYMTDLISKYRKSGNMFHFFKNI